MRSVDQFRLPSFLFAACSLDLKFCFCRCHRVVGDNFLLNTSAAIDVAVTVLAMDDEDVLLAYSGLDVRRLDWSHHDSASPNFLKTNMSHSHTTRNSRCSFRNLNLFVFLSLIASANVASPPCNIHNKMCPSFSAPFCWFASWSSEPHVSYRAV